MRDYELTLTIKVSAASLELAKLKAQSKLEVVFDESFRFDNIRGAMFCPMCERIEIKFVRWDIRHKGIVSVTLNDRICCSEDEGEFPTAASAQSTVDDINKRLKTKAGLDLLLRYCPCCSAMPLADDGERRVLCERCNQWFDIDTHKPCEPPA